MSAEANLKQKGIVLPNPPKPVANYVRAVRTGNLLYTAGGGPEPHIPKGKLGATSRSSRATRPRARRA